MQQKMSRKETKTTSEKKNMHMLFGGIKPVCFQSVFFNRSLAEDRVFGAQEWECRHDVTKDGGEIIVERLRANQSCARARE